MTYFFTSLQNKDQKIWILSGFILLMLLHVLFTFNCFYGGDDINYARHAARVMYSGFDAANATDQFQLRWTPVYVTAFFYRVFGINAFSSACLSMVSFAGTAWLIHQLIKNTTIRVYLLTMTLYFFSQSTLFYMHRLLPDPAVCFGVFCMYISYRNYKVTQTSSLKNAILFTLAFFFTLITKETIVIAMPMFAFFFIRDMIKKENHSFWLRAIAACIIVSSLYLLYFKISTGDLLFRFHLLNAVSYVNECRFDVMPAIYTWKRISYELWRAMLINGDMLLILPALTSIIYRKKIADLSNTLESQVFIILLLCSNFMTISFTSYVPLCHDPRHFMFLLPFAAILAAPLINAYAKTPQRFVLFPIVMLIAAALMFKLPSGTNKFIYLAIATLCALRYAFSADKKWIANIFVAAFILILSSFYVSAFIRPLYPYYNDQQKLLKRNFSTSSNAEIYASEPMSAEITEFMFGFHARNMHIYPLEERPKKISSPVYYLLNGALPPADQQHIHDLVWYNMSLMDKETEMYLYRADSVVFKPH